MPQAKIIEVLAESDEYQDEIDKLKKQINELEQEIEIRDSNVEQLSGQVELLQKRAELPAVATTRYECKTLIQDLRTPGPADVELADHLNAGWEILHMDTSTTWSPLIAQIQIYRIITLRRAVPVIPAREPAAQSVEIPPGDDPKPDTSPQIRRVTGTIIEPAAEVPAETPTMAEFRQMVRSGQYSVAAIKARGDAMVYQRAKEAFYNAHKPRAFTPLRALSSKAAS